MQESRVNLKSENGDINGYFLGDPGYQSLPYLLTPVNNLRNDAERRYNDAQRKSRGVVERLFGIWKRRFPCLSFGLGVRLPTVFSVIVACAVLYNIAVISNDPEFDNDEDPVSDGEDSDILTTCHTLLTMTMPDLEL